MNKFTLALLVGFTGSIKIGWPVEENQDADFLVNDSSKKKDDQLIKERKIAFMPSFLGGLFLFLCKLSYKS